MVNRLLTHFDLGLIGGALGGDDCNVQVWRTLDAFVGDEPRPFITMSNRHFSNIFALRFSLHTERVYSGANDHQLIVHDIATRGKLRVYGTVGAYYRIATHVSTQEGLRD